MNKPPTEGGHSHGRQLVPAVGWELSWAMGGDLHTWVLQQRSRRGTQTSYRTAGCEHVSRDNQVASSDRQSLGDDFSSTPGLCWYRTDYEWVSKTRPDSWGGAWIPPLQGRQQRNCGHVFKPPQSELFLTIMCTTFNGIIQWSQNGDWFLIFPKATVWQCVSRTSKTLMSWDSVIPLSSRCAKDTFKSAVKYRSICHMASFILFKKREMLRKRAMIKWIVLSLYQRLWCSGYKSCF